MHMLDVMGLICYIWDLLVVIFCDIPYDGLH